MQLLEFYIPINIKRRAYMQLLEFYIPIKIKRRAYMQLLEFTSDQKTCFANCIGI
jgi:hypothetical protein